MFLDGLVEFMIGMSDPALAPVLVFGVKTGDRGEQDSSRQYGSRKQGRCWARKLVRGTHGLCLHKKHISDARPLGKVGTNSLLAGWRAPPSLPSTGAAAPVWSGHPRPLPLTLRFSFLSGRNRLERQSNRGRAALQRRVSPSLLGSHPFPTTPAGRISPIRGFAPRFFLPLRRKLIALYGGISFPGALENPQSFRAIGAVSSLPEILRRPQSGDFLRNGHINELVQGYPFQFRGLP
jgi:hypothetical protein